MTMKTEKSNNSGGPEGSEADRPLLSVEEFCGIMAVIWLL